MGRFILFGENFLNERLFPAHTVTANEEGTGREVWQVATGRRQKSRNYWTPTTSNSAAWVKVVCDRVRVADMLALDRGHNLAGKTVRVQFSNDGSVWDDAWAGTVPSNVFPNSRLTDGVKTEEGAFLVRFPRQAALNWRVYFDAMGSGLKPEVVGAWLGLAYRLENALEKPFDHGQRELIYEQTVSPHAWVGAGQIAQRRTGTFRIRTADRQEWAQGRYHVEEIFMRRRPAWVVMDDDESEKAVLAFAPPGTAGFQVSGDWSQFRGEFPWVEHEPRLV